MADAGDSTRKTVGLAQLLQDYLPEPVKLLLFTAKRAPLSKEQQLLLEDIVKLSGRPPLDRLAANRQPDLSLHA